MDVLQATVLVCGGVMSYDESMETFSDHPSSYLGIYISDGWIDWLIEHMVTLLSLPQLYIIQSIGWHNHIICISLIFFSFLCDFSNMNKTKTKEFFCIHRNIIKRLIGKCCVWMYEWCLYRVDHNDSFYTKFS